MSPRTAEPGKGTTFDVILAVGASSRLAMKSKEARPYYCTFQSAIS